MGSNGLEKVVEAAVALLRRWQAPGFPALAPWSEEEEVILKPHTEHFNK